MPTSLLHLSRKRLKTIKISSFSIVSLVYVSSCRNIESIRDYPYWISRKNSLELIDSLLSINDFSSGFLL